MIDLSIIIVSFRGWNRLIKCLESLNAFTGINIRTEVIVVDNRSDDGMIYEIEKRFSKFKFIHNKNNGGFANGCNLGSKNAGGEFLLFLNPDTVASEPELEKLLFTAKRNPEFTILSCKQINENNRNSISFGSFPQLCNLTGFQRAIFRNRNIVTRTSTPEFSLPDWISGSVVMIRRETFSILDGFDEDFWMYFEDVDLCRRVRNIHGQVVFCNNIIIEHNHGGSSRINLKTASLTKTEVQISRHVYISKHKTGLNRVIIQSFLIINNLISGGLMALVGVLFFFIPKVFLRTMIFMRLISYYSGSIFRLSWISPMSVNFDKTRKV
jgi:GT2 family glycosyltransferase